jgi:hypothetical protein
MQRYEKKLDWPNKKPQNVRFLTNLNIWGSKGEKNEKKTNKVMRGLISCVGNPYPLFAMATQSHLSTQPCLISEKEKLISGGVALSLLDLLPTSYTNAHCA